MACCHLECHLGLIPFPSWASVLRNVQCQFSTALSKLPAHPKPVLLPASCLVASPPRPENSESPTASSSTSCDERPLGFYLLCISNVPLKKKKTFCCPHSNPLYIPLTTAFQLLPASFPQVLPPTEWPEMVSIITFLFYIFTLSTCMDLQAVFAE